MADWSNVVVIESDIERLLTDYIREELNDNSFDVIFDLGFWVRVNVDGTHVMQIKPEGFYHGTDKQVVPVVIEDYDGQILALEGLFNAEYTLPLTFQVPIEDQELMINTINAINEVKNRNRQQLRRFRLDTRTEQIEYFTAVVTTNNLTPIGDSDIQMGKDYVYSNINFFFDISKDVLYGNQFEVYMTEEDEPDEADWVRLQVLAPSFVRENTPETIQTFDTQQAVTILQESEYTFSFGLIMLDNDLHWGILEDIFTKSNLQNPRKIKIIFKYFDGLELKTKFTFEDDVVMLVNQCEFAIGEEASAVLVFKKFLVEESEE